MIFKKKENNEKDKHLILKRILLPWLTLLSSINWSVAIYCGIFNVCNCYNLFGFSLKNNVQVG